MSNDTSRLETLCDGVWAIALTLLVLDLRVPPSETAAAAGGLTVALLRLWPSYLGYGISFLILGIMWANHHSLFKLVARTDETFVYLNLLLLLFVAVQPFPTALVAEYLRVPAERSTAVIVYGAVMTATAVAYNAVWWHASRGHRLLRADVLPAAVKLRTRRFLAGPIFYLAATVIAYFNAATALAIVGGLAVLYMIPIPHWTRTPQAEVASGAAGER